MPRKKKVKSPAQLAEKIGGMIFSGWKEEDMPILVQMYRSALVVLKPTKEQKKRGACSIIVYHDPAWMGAPSTPEMFKEFSVRIDMYGQRNGPDMRAIFGKHAMYGKKEEQVLVIPSYERAEEDRKKIQLWLDGTAFIRQLKELKKEKGE